MWRAPSQLQSFLLPANAESDEMTSHKYGLAAKTDSKWRPPKSLFLKTNFFRIGGFLRGLNVGEWKSWMFTCYRQKQKRRQLERHKTIGLLNGQRLCTRVLIETNYFSNSLIIHQALPKKLTTVTGVWRFYLSAYSLVFASFEKIYQTQCFIGYPNTSNFGKNTPLCVVCLILFSMFGYLDETLSIVFDVLHSSIKSCVIWRMISWQ